MLKKPLHHALLALAYIAGIILLISQISELLGDKEDIILFPIAGLGLLVLSVAVMAYLFFYRPVLLLLENQREAAMKFFFQTIGIFAVSLAIVFLISIFLLW